MEERARVSMEGARFAMRFGSTDVDDAVPTAGTFALVSAVLVAVTALAVALVVGELFERDLVALGRADALAVARALVARIEREVLEERPWPSAVLDLHDPADLDRIERLLDALSPSLDVRRLALVDRGGEVVFCTDRDRIGSSVADWPVLQEALAGTAVVRLGSMALSPLGDPKDRGEILEILAPLAPQGGGSAPPGALVLLRGADDLARLRRAAVARLLGAILPLMALLFAVQLVFVHRADRRVARWASLVRQGAEELRLSQQSVIRSNRLAAIGELAGGLAHELNNPLAGMRIYAEGLRRRADSASDGTFAAETVKATDSLLREIDRCRGVITSLLTFARADRQSTREQADVNAVIRDVLDLVTLGARRVGVEPRLTLAEDLPPAAMAPGELGQVIMNLVSNAVQAMAGGGTLSLASTTEGDRVVVSVSDTGCGIAAEDLDRVFEPFFTTKPPGEGTGLGLSISYGLVAARGGSITVASTPGQGTTFRVVLPPVRREEPSA